MLIPTITCPALWRVLIISNCLITLRNKSCGKSCERHLSKANIVSTCPSFVSLLFHNKLLQKQYSWTEKNLAVKNLNIFSPFFSLSQKKNVPSPQYAKSITKKSSEILLYAPSISLWLFFRIFSLPYPFFFHQLIFWTSELFCFSLFLFFQFPLIWVCSATIWWKKYYYKINKKDTIHT